MPAWNLLDPLAVVAAGPAKLTDKETLEDIINANDQYEIFTALSAPEALKILEKDKIPMNTSIRAGN